MAASIVSVRRSEVLIVTNRLEDEATRRVILQIIRTSYGASDRTSLSEIPFRYERVLWAMQNSGELAIEWSRDGDHGWLRYVRITHPSAKRQVNR